MLLHIGFVCHLLAGERQGEPARFCCIFSGTDEIHPISIAGIIRTIYALLSNFQMYVQLESFSCSSDILSDTHMHVLCDCCTFILRLLLE